MSALVSRQPLQPLSMSSSQRPPRRLSARLQEKEDAQPVFDGVHPTANGKTSVIAVTKRGLEAAPVNKKRKLDYDEEDDGFLFTRARTQNSRTSTLKSAVRPQVPPIEKPALPEVEAEYRLHGGDGDVGELPKRKRNKMSFSTPNIREEKPIRRSKRMSNEHDRSEGSPQRRVRRKDLEKQTVEAKHDQEKTPAATSVVAVGGEEHSATKIALPFADTPVIRRNKAMREGKAGKGGERRSSLGLRGRRASSLIDSGTSNALPHNEVESMAFYKHIESEGLPEPRRMRQLLTWCATRAMGERPTGTEFEDQSVRMAARVIHEELLKDLANRSEMSDWFGREDAPKPAIPLVRRPNPKNIQNGAKIVELEEQIKRLQADRQSLEALLRPPSLPLISRKPSKGLSEHPSIDLKLLSPLDARLLSSLASTSTASMTISTSLNSMTASLGPTIDAFADGVHQIGQYCEATENVAGKVLGICAEKLEDREKEGRRRAIGVGNGDFSTSKDEFGGVLRSLSRLER